MTNKFVQEVRYPRERTFITRRGEGGRVFLPQHKNMNSSIVLMNEFVLATPLEQFQILPLSAQNYSESLSLTSLETANLFPQVAEDETFVYLLGGSALFEKVTS